MRPQRVCFIVESGTDIRLVDGMEECASLTILARRMDGGKEINWPPASAIDLIKGPASRLDFARMIFRYLRSEYKQTDFVVVQGYGIAALSANLACRLSHLRSAMLVCSPAENYYSCRKRQDMNGPPFRRHELWGMRLLAYLNARLGYQYVALSEHLAEVIRSHGTRRPIHVVPIYGVDTQIFQPSSVARAAVKARLGLPTSGKLIFFSSRIAPEKDAETLLAAAKILLDAGRDLWILHRSGGHQSFLKDAQRFGVAQRVIASDAAHPHRQLPQDYQASDLCVQASRAEGLGFSPLEAIACGTPVVAAAVGGLKETIIDGHTGWSYPVGDIDRLADCIAQALDDPVEAARRAAVGRRMVIERYDRRAVFAQLKRIIRAEEVEPYTVNDFEKAI